MRERGNREIRKKQEIEKEKIMREKGNGKRREKEDGKKNSVEAR